MRSIRRIIKYLKNHGFNDFEVTKAELTSPTQKQFMSIVLFLNQQWNPEFEYSDKPVEDVPKEFKFCGYPFSISKSALKSCGSPHTWPTLLGAIHWLVQLLEYLEAADGESDVATTTVHSPYDTESKFFFEYLCKGYESFLNGEEDMQAVLDEDLQAQLRQRDETVLEDIQDLSDAKEKLMKVTDDARSNPSPLEQLTSDKSVMENDVAKFTSFVEQLEEREQTLSSTIDELTSENESFAQEIQRMNAEKERLMSIVDAQEMSAEEIEEILSERTRLESDLNSVRERRECALESIATREAVESRLVDELQRAVKFFNEKATDLALIPASVETGDVDFELRLAPRGSSVEEILPCKVKETIKPALIEQTNKIIAKCGQKHDALLAMQDDLDRYEERVSERKDEIDSLETKVKRQQHIYKTEKERLRQQIKEKEREVDMLRVRTDEKHADIIEAYTKAKQDRSKLRMEEENLVKQCNAERNAINNVIIESLTMLMDHKSFLEEKLKTLGIQWDSLM